MRSTTSISHFPSSIHFVPKTTDPFPKYQYCVKGSIKLRKRARRRDVPLIRGIIALRSNSANSRIRGIKHYLERESRNEYQIAKALIGDLHFSRLKREKNPQIPINPAKNSSNPEGFVVFFFYSFVSCTLGIGSSLALMLSRAYPDSLQ